ncbi:MAG: hypothetical protein ABIU05_01915, partial [Nitrospirales bacterium]
AQDVLARLRNPHLRYVYLCIDASHPMKTIMQSKKLRSLLTERHALFNKKRTQSKGTPNTSAGVLLRKLPCPLVGPAEPLGKAMSFEFIDQLNRCRCVDSVGVWLQYFRCFELHKKAIERNIDAVAWKIYSDKDEEAAIASAQQGIKRVKQMIAAALNDTFPIFR